MANSRQCSTASSSLAATSSYVSSYHWDENKGLENKRISISMGSSCSALRPAEISWARCCAAALTIPEREAEMSRNTSAFRPPTGRTCCVFAMQMRTSFIKLTSGAVFIKLTSGAVRPNRRRNSRAPSGTKVFRSKLKPVFVGFSISNSLSMSVRLRFAVVCAMRMP